MIVFAGKEAFYMLKKLLEFIENAIMGHADVNRRLSDTNYWDD